VAGLARLTIGPRAPWGAIDLSQSSLSNTPLYVCSVAHTALPPSTERGFDGIAWNTPWFMVANYLALGASGLLWVWITFKRGTRLAAMQRADRNIAELLTDLGAKFHRLRQSGIDEELFDVIAGFDAMATRAVPRV
jgi:hypothetical protein